MLQGLSSQCLAQRVSPLERTHYAAPVNPVSTHLRSLAKNSTRSTFSIRAMSTSTIDVPQVVLSNGAKMPMIGLGTFAGAGGGISIGEAIDISLRIGYRHFDTASQYLNEEEIGEALQRNFKKGIVKREEVFVTAKVWGADHGNVEEAIKTSLKKLQLDYVDLYYIHWPCTPAHGKVVDPPLANTWEQMEGVYAKGLALGIGASNMTVKKMSELIKTAKVKPHACQVEGHPYFRNNGIFNYCKQQGIHLTAFSPLGSPMNAKMYGRAEDVKVLFMEQVAHEIAAETDKSVAQVLIRWGVQRGTSVVPKGINEEQLFNNLDVNWSMTDAQMARLTGLDYQNRMLIGYEFLRPEGPYTTPEELWDNEPIVCMSESGVDWSEATPTM